MKCALLLILALGAIGCTVGPFGKSLTEDQLEAFFRGRTVHGRPVVALKKRIIGGLDAYLATIHGYPNNLSVCEELVKPYNADASMSTLPGQYFCEELR